MEQEDHHNSDLKAIPEWLKVWDEHTSSVSTSKSREYLHILIELLQSEGKTLI